MVQEVKILERKDENDQSQYWRMKFPLMSARENCTRLQVKQIGDDPNGKFLLGNSIKHPEAPHVEGAVQIFYFDRGLMSTNPEDPDVIDYETYSIISLGGYVPARLTNYTIANENSKGLIDAYNFCFKNKK